MGCTCLRSALPLARARSAPTKQTVILPQISLYTVLLLVMTSHRFHRSTQMIRVRIIKRRNTLTSKIAKSPIILPLSTTFLQRFSQHFSTDGGRNPIGRRTESDQTADGNRSDGGRNLIGRRTETDWTANGNRSDSERERWHT